MLSDIESHVASAEQRHAGPPPASAADVSRLPLSRFKQQPHGTSALSAVTGSDFECYICLAEYSDGEELRTMPCSHRFHVDCVDKWLRDMHGVCPVCR